MVELGSIYNSFELAPVSSTPIRLWGLDATTFYL
jgi:hypothetical protein